MSDANEKIRVRFEVNGDLKDIYVAPQSTLVEVLRKEFQLTGTKEGCDDGNCGACTVLMNGKAVKSCCILIGQVEGASITTIEGIKNGDRLHPIQQAFIDHFAIQCGFCTPGMIMAAISILNENPNATEEEIREGLHGNLCRCTGYKKIVEAVESARDEMNASGR